MNRILVLIIGFLIANFAVAAPDCTEKSIGISELQTLVDSGEIKTQQDFLNALPDGSLQNFTFVTNSLSIHRGNPTSDANGQGKVVPMWPRVLRSSADGKVTISFVCDPKNPSYGKVETLYFDETSNQIKSIEWDFSKSDKSPDQRTTQNPKSCIGCHAGGAIDGTPPPLKFNWPQYPNWGDCQRDRGITLYGAIDDNMFTNGASAHQGLLLPAKSCTPEMYDKAVNDSVDDYKKFREKQTGPNGNACFNSLPWPKKADGTIDTSPSSDVYPYNKSQETLDYSKRPNLRFTNNYVHWLARQNFQRLKSGDRSDYEKMKYYIVMEDERCLSPSDVSHIKDLMGSDFKTNPIVATDESEYGSIAVSAPILSSLAKKAGLQNKDWTMEFRSDLPSYQGGYSAIFSLVAGQVLKDISAENLSIAEESKNSLDTNVLGASANGFYGGASNYQCVDDIAQQIRFNDPNRKKLCDMLHSENDKHLAALEKTQSGNGTCQLNNPTKETRIPALASDMARTIKQLDQASINRGRTLVQPNSKGKCIVCHSAGAKSGLPPDYRFVPDAKANKNEFEESLAVLKARQLEGFANTMKAMLIDSKAMPPITNDLSDQDRQDIAAYISSLTN